MTQTLVLPFSHGGSEEAGQPIIVGEFAVQPFQSAVKLSAAFAANSPLEVHTSTLEERDGNGSIERTVAALPYFDAKNYETALRVAIASVVPGLPSPEDGPAMMLRWVFFENYAAEYHQCLEDKFFADFRNAQGPHVALGGSFFPIQDVRGLDGCLFLVECHDVSFNLSQGVIAWGIVEGGFGRRLACEFLDFLTELGSHRALASVRAGNDPHIMGLEKSRLFRRGSLRIWHNRNNPLTRARSSGG